MLQNYVTPLPLSLVAAVHLASLAALIALLQASRTRYPGWRVLGPSATHWFCFIGSWAFSTLVTWVWLFVGSARYDAEKQMFYALVLILAFGAAAAGTGLYLAHMRRMGLRWRGTTIRWRGKEKEIAEDMSDFEAFRRAFSGAYHLRFRDGAILKLDLYARNAQELAVAISEVAGVEID